MFVINTKSVVSFVSAFGFMASTFLTGCAPVETTSEFDQASGSLSHVDCLNCDDAEKTKKTKHAEIDDLSFVDNNSGKAASKEDLNINPITTPVDLWDETSQEDPATGPIENQEPAAETTDTDIMGFPNPWPRTVFTPYVDASTTGAIRLADVAHETGVFHYTLGFVVADNADHCRAIWPGSKIEVGPAASDQYGEYTLYDEVKILRSHFGGDVAIAFGGPYGDHLASACTDVKDLVSEYKRVIETLNVTRVEFAIEGGYAFDTGATKRRAQAIAEIQSQYKAEGRELHVWFSLPVQTYGFTAVSLDILHHALKHGVHLNGVNGYTMNYRPSVAPNPKGQMGIFGVKALYKMRDQLALLLEDFQIHVSDSELWGMLGIIPLIGENDVPGQTFNLSDAKVTLEHLDSIPVGRLSMWSVSRDTPCSGLMLSSSVCSGSSDQVNTHDFMRILKTFMN
ncbi:MAG: hypothetical protein CMH54_09660 [Myxococcales bacterium]|nr:hypothetical protein [Myxococcales bacterium]